MRLKDLLGRKTEPDEPTGRLIDLDDQPSPRLRRSADASAPAVAASGRGVGPVASVHRTAPIAPIAPDAPIDRTAPVDRTAPIAPIAPDAPIAPVAPASLADLFTRLLAAEQGETAPPPSSVPIRLSEADVERLAAGVAARFAQGMLRDEVRQIVVEVSERLVREEIARIRQTVESQQP